MKKGIYTDVKRVMIIIDMMITNVINILIGENVKNMLRVNQTSQYQNGRPGEINTCQNDGCQKYNQTTSTVR